MEIKGNTNGQQPDDRSRCHVAPDGDGHARRQFPTEPRFDEAQAYAAGQRAVMETKKPLPCHPMLLSHLARAAGPIRAALDRGETVVISAGGRELARYEP